MPDADLKSRLQSDLTDAIRDPRRGARRRPCGWRSPRCRRGGGRQAARAPCRTKTSSGCSAARRRSAARRSAAYEQAGRPDRAERETAELAVLEGYLPAQLSDDELGAIVAEAVAEARAEGASGPAAMGRVMKAVQPRVAGRAEGGRVAAEVRRRLAHADDRSPHGSRTGPGLSGAGDGGAWRPRPVCRAPGAARRLAAAATRRSGGWSPGCRRRRWLRRRGRWTRPVRRGLVATHSAGDQPGGEPGALEGAEGGRERLARRIGDAALLTVP